MSTTPHTPGKWYILERPYRGEAYSVVVDTNTTRAPVKTQLAIVGIHDTNRSDEETLANAILIVAAPETAAERDRLHEENATLVAALRAVVAGYDTSVAPGEYLDDLLYHANVTARAALAKAEGRLS